MVIPVFKLAFVCCGRVRKVGIIRMCMSETCLLKNLKIFAHTHCSNLSLVGSQFISRNSLTLLGQGRGQNDPLTIFAKYLKNGVADLHETF